MNAVNWLFQMGHVERGWWYSKFLSRGVAVLAGFLLGSSVLVFGPALTLAIIIGVVVFVTAFTYPEFILLLFLGMVSGLLPSQFNPYLRFGGRGFYLSDFVLLLLLAVVIVKALADRNFRLVRTPLDTPFLFFCGSVFVGMGTAMLSHGIKFSDTTYQARILLYYLVFFPVTNLIRDKAQLIRLIHGVILMCSFMACAIVLQAFLGRSVSFMDPGVLRSEGDLIRFFFPGIQAIYFSLIILLCDIVIRKSWWLQPIRIAEILLFCLVILVSLSRNILISGLIALTVMAIILRRYNLPHLVVGLIVITLFGSILLITPRISGNDSGLFNYITVFGNRISNLFSGADFSSGGTLNWRWREIQFALPQIAKNPIFGLGMEVSYRPGFYIGDPLTSYIDNAYLYLWLKTGLLGLVSFFWLSILALKWGFRHWHDPKDDFLKAVSIGITLAYLSNLFSNLVAPSFTQGWSLAFFGVFLGVNCVIYSLSFVDPLAMKGEISNG